MTEESKKPRAWMGLLRTLRFMVLRLLVLFITVTVGVYLSILIANMGGKVDEIRDAQIQENVNAQLLADPELQRLTTEERRELIDRRIALERERLGLDQPFILRSFRYLGTALSLNLGRAENMTKFQPMEPLEPLISQAW